MIKKFSNFDIFSNVLITIPHSGTFLPSEIKKSSLSNHQKKLENYCIDWYTDDLYDFRHIMRNNQALNTISNVIINVNRKPDINDCVPLVYEKTQIYKADQEPDKKLRELLITNYHIPYHEKIKSTKKIFILDGHSTNSSIKDLSGKKMTKDIVISNWQNSKLDPKGGTYTCPERYIDCYLEELDKRLHHSIEKNTEYNSTYGYIEATHGLNKLKAENDRAPLIFQETNEDLYIKDGKKDSDKIQELNEIFAESLMSMIIKMKKYLI